MLEPFISRLMELETNHRQTVNHITRVRKQVETGLESKYIDKHLYYAYLDLNTEIKKLRPFLVTADRYRSLANRLIEVIVRSHLDNSLPHQHTKLKEIIDYFISTYEDGIDGMPKQDDPIDKHYKLLKEFSYKLCCTDL